MSQEALVKQKKSIYIVWIIPVVAMILAGWMIFKHYDNKGYEVLITFDNGNGMVVGKTPLIYNGIQIGKVTDLQIHPGDISKVDVTVTVEKKAKAVARKGNIFWKVEPRLSLTEVTGLSTILGGVYIEVMPSVKDPLALFNLPKQTTFIANDEIPINIFEPGRNLILHADTLDIKVGAPVMYKKVNIGGILDSYLVKDGVDYIIHIDEKYMYLVKENSNFWKISGVEVRASLAGLRVEMDSLASVIAGGISMSSPEDGALVKHNKQEYTLYEDFDKLDLVNECITLVSKNGYNIDIKSAKIFFKGSVAGDIISMKYNPSTDQTTFKIKLKSEFRHLANKNAHFWMVEPSIGLNSIKGLDAIVRGPYISFETSSKSKVLKNSFNLYENPPEIKGEHFKLSAKESFKLKSGVNVIHKDIVIGTLRKFQLSKDNQDVEFEIVIANKYKNLVNDSSNFYIQGAMEMGASFKGVYLNIGSITSMVNGGIVLKTDNANAVLTRKNFKLYDSFKAYQNSTYTKDGGKFFTLISDKLDSVQDNSPVLFKGIKVGKVVSYTLNKNTNKINIKIYIKKEYSDQINQSTNFYNMSGVEVKASLDGIKISTGSLESIVTGGIAFKTPLKAEEAKQMHKFTLYKDEDAVNEKYVDISFIMSEDSGLKKGSKIVYKSIPVGQVKELKLIDDEVVVYAVIKQEHENLLVSDSIFWVEDVMISIDKIKNPSAIISGAFIKISKGRNGVKATKFALSKTAPVATLEKKGLRVIVTGKKLSSLKIGSPIFYRQVKIGSVEAVSLSKDSKGVDLKLYIDECYSYLVRENSIFYNATAIGMDISLFGVKISTETISTMINGGITMVTPDEVLAKSTDLKRFKLFDAPEEDWLEYEPELINDVSTCRNVGAL